MNERTNQGVNILSREQIEQALAILRDERHTHPITPKQIKSFRLFRISFWTFWALWACFFATMLMRDSPRRASHLPEWTPVEVLQVSLLIALFACSVPLLMSLRGTWSLFRQTWREFRLAQRTGLWRILKAQSRPTWWARWVLWLVLIAVFLVLLPFALVAMAIPIAGWIMLLAIPLYMFVHYAKPRVELLADARGLQHLLEQRISAAERSSTDFVTIPSSDFEKLARIESAQIQRRRAEAIDAEAAERATYSLLKSQTFLSEAAQLDMQTRLHVDARSRKLTTEPTPAEAIRDAGEAVRHLHVPETTVEILYVVDEVARCINLLSLRSLGEETPFSGEAETPHA